MTANRQEASVPASPELFGAKYQEREGRTRYSGKEPCAHCARPVDTNRPHWRVEYDEQGTFAIGSECRKLFPAAVRCEP